MQVKYAHITRTGKVAIPKALLRRSGLREGMTVLFLSEGTSVRMIPMDHAWFWSKDWQAREQEATEELRDGKGRSYKNAENALGWIKRPPFQSNLKGLST